MSETKSRPFTTLLWVEGRWTGDGRFVMADAIRWDGILPMSLTVDHDGIEEVVGRVDSIERMPGASADERFIVGRGVYDLGGPPDDLAHQVERLIEQKYARGVSMELDAVQEGGVAPDTAPENMPAGSGGWVTVVETARVRALSVVTTAAFAEAHITFDDAPMMDDMPPAIPGPTPMRRADMPEPVDDGDVVIVGAAGHTITIPNLPPASWFNEPTDVMIEGALTVTDEGRVYGLLAPADTPFIGNPSVLGVPMGNVDYSRFLRGSAFVAGGQRVVAGNITMGCGHTKGQTAASMMEHHDNTCSVVAQINVGETTQTEPRGVWVAGAVLPGVSADQFTRMMACQLSGEWMQKPGGWELIAALLVPVPAFAMARRAASLTMRDGRLVASAIPVQFASGGCGCGCGETATADERIAALEAEVRALRSLRPVAIAALRDRIVV